MRLYDKLNSFYSKDFINGLGWNFIGQIVVRLSNLLTTIIVARKLAVNDFGYFSYFIGIYAFLVSTTSLSTRISNNRFTALNSASNSDLIPFTSSVLLSFSVCVILAILTLFTDLNFGVEQSVYFMFLGILGVCSEVFSLGIYGILEGRVLYTIVNLFSMFGAVTRLMVISKLSDCAELKSLMMAYSTISILILIVLLIVYTRISKHIIFEEISINLIKEALLLLKTTPPILFSAVIPGVFLTLVLSSAIASSPKEVALFNISYQLRGFAIYLPLVMINMYQSFSNSIENFEKKLLVTSNYLTFGSILLLFIGSFYLNVVYGNSYFKSGFILRTLLPFIFVSVFNEISRQNWIKNKKNSKLYIIPIVSYLTGYLFFLSLEGFVYVKLCLFVISSDIVYWLLSRVRFV